MLQIILILEENILASFIPGRRYKSSSDEMKKEISDMVTNPGSVFNLFKENILIPGEEEQLKVK